jgi:uncharacterized surface protein with fasciclin (FAS1) repeats
MFLKFDFMTKKINRLCLRMAILVVAISFGCEEEYQSEIYARPDWLAGKLYDQILEQPDLSTFAQSIERIGFDKIINVSGSYTVFGPSNEAWNTYFQEHPEYNSLDDIPLDKLEKLVKYHFLQNPWSKNQLRKLDVFGWIDTLDITNNKPRGFKRETFFLGDNLKVGVASLGRPSDKQFRLIDTTETSFHRINVTDSRKYAPIFFKEYFNIYDLNNSDYEFYFNRNFEGGDQLYFAQGKIISEEIFAENGFIYVIDKVVEPLKTVYKIMAEKSGQYLYNDFLALLNMFPEFEYNEQRTLDQPGAKEGLKVDSLFDLTFPELVFDINNEKTSARQGEVGLPENVTIRYHHGMLAPTNEAFQNFINQYLKIPEGWISLTNAPQHIRRIIARSHMCFNPVYPTDFNKGFYNGQEDIVQLDESRIVEKKFGSNASFIGMNEAIVPRAFSSVTGPIYLRQGYKKVMYAIERAGLLPALKRKDKDYSLFIESDMNTGIDSSFFYNEGTFIAYEILGGGFFEPYVLNTNDLRNLILNHVTSRTPVGIAKKEFIPTLSGNFLIFNNETGEVSGTKPTTFGFGDAGERMPNVPEKVDFPTDNGNTYEIENWFSFTANDLYIQISSGFPAFHDLLVKAGLARVKEFRYTFISDNEFYTIFIPTETALTEAGFDTLATADLKNELLLHFVRNNLIFTDGASSPGYYDTERVDERSTSFSTFNTKINIQPDYDVIRIKGKSGENDIEVPESENTNRMAGVVTSENPQAVYPSMYINAVIHQVDKALKVKDLDTD